MSTREPSVDLIQVFCVNFPCDIDLGQPPGVNRFRPSVKWPSFDQCPGFSDLDPFERLVRVQELEIHLKRSRYSIETMQLVLAGPILRPHLVHAIRHHYAVVPVGESFRADHVVRALAELSVLPPDADPDYLTATALKKFKNWLNAAVEKCRNVNV